MNGQNRPPGRTLDEFTDFQLLKVHEVAECLRIGVDSCYELIARGDLPAIRLGRKILVPAFALKKWIVTRTGVPEPAPEVVSLPHRQRH